jgi:nucleoside-diphosphate-sugar epimerase
MILLVGGLNGFIGSNTTEALVEHGQDCVVTRHKNTESLVSFRSTLIIAM